MLAPGAQHSPEFGFLSRRVRAPKEATADAAPDAPKSTGAARPDAPLNIAAEVQLIYQPYLDKGRKLSHLPYKVARCDTAGELARDAGGKKQSAEVRAAVKAAERECMGSVMAERGLRSAGRPPRPPRE